MSVFFLPLTNRVTLSKRTATGTEETKGQEKEKESPEHDT